MTLLHYATPANPMAVMRDDDGIDPTAALVVAIKSATDPTLPATVAEQRARRSLAYIPASLDALGALALATQHRAADVVQVLWQAAQTRPALRPANIALAWALMATGEDDAAWAALRTGRAALPGVPNVRIPPAPAWQGECLEGRTLVVHDTVFGNGDALWMARYLPVLATMGARDDFPRQPGTRAGDREDAGR